MTLTATVGTGGLQTPLGAITFMDGSAFLGTGTVDATGQAMLTTTALLTGTHTLRAVYAESGAVGGSMSPGVVEAVLASTFAVVVSPATMTLHAGQPGTATVTLTSGRGAWCSRERCWHLWGSPGAGDCAGGRWRCWPPWRTPA